MNRSRRCSTWASNDKQTPWEESSLIVNFTLFTKANPPPSLEEVRRAAEADVAELAKAAQGEEQLQAAIKQINEQLDALDDEESDEAIELRRQRKKLKADLASLLSASRSIHTAIAHTQIPLHIE